MRHLAVKLNGIPSATLTPCVVLTAVVLANTLAVTRSSAADVVITESDGKAVVTIDGQPFTEYVFSGHAKPILYPIIGPHGVEMTRHYPMQENVDNEASDHPHHKSLWYTHDNVNGVQFWMEYTRNDAEKQPGKIIQKSMRIDGNSIVTQNDWTAPDGKVVCSDERRLTFDSNDVGRMIDFQITLQASHGDVVFGDTKEGTMGIRTNPLLRLEADPRRGNHTAAGKSINSEGVEGKAMWGKRAKWVDYWAPVDGQTVGIAIMDHPGNPRHPTWWHARQYGLVAANPFGIHDFEKQPSGTGDMKIDAGTSVTFRYRFLFHRGDYQQAGIERQFAEFGR